MTLGLTSNELALPFQMTPSYLLFLRSHVNTAGVQVPHMTLRCPKLSVTFKIAFKPLTCGFVYIRDEV